ncbi:hypothetical protein ABT120_41635 [Nonomuraea angiospora]|uniref:hypothetical protein n=1 Tax=Nonomuraea angiospora TaxID=46172 RepID=UPI0033348971
MTRHAAVRRDHPTGRTVVIGHTAVRCGQPPTALPTGHAALCRDQPTDRTAVTGLGP